MHIDTQTLVAIGVGLHLLAALARAIWKTPQRQAQIDAIEQKVDDILGQLTGAKTLGAKTLGTKTVERKGETK